MRIIICFVSALILSGCATDSTFRFSGTPDNAEDLNRIISNSDISIVDEQFKSYTEELTLRRFLRGTIQTDNKGILKNKINVKLEPCNLEQPFYQRISSLLSIVTFTVVPFTNVYVCQTNLSIQDARTKKTKSYHMDVKYHVGFGIIDLIAYGATDSMNLLSKKISTIYVLLNEVAKNDI